MAEPAILVIDDNPTKRALLRRMLAALPARILDAADGPAALACAGGREFALFILDVDMPGMDGFELARRLGDSPEQRATPIIFISASFKDSVNRMRGYDAGAVDYLEDPVNPIILRSKVRVFLDLYLANERARHQAAHDPLTGLPNRLRFLDRLKQAVGRARKDHGECALLYVDIDGFKAVNDSHGHLAGDELLKQIARRLSATVSAHDLVARLGGDEFAVLLDDPAAAARAAHAIVEAVSQPYDISLPGLQALPISIGASVGGATYPRTATSIDELIRKADDAMYRAKKGGKNRYEAA